MTCEELRRFLTDPDAPEPTDWIEQLGAHFGECIACCDWSLADTELSETLIRMSPEIRKAWEGPEGEERLRRLRERLRSAWQ